VKTRVWLAKFFGCSPVHLRDINGYEIQAAFELAEEIRRAHER
jgi:hypothetical protein